MEKSGVNPYSVQLVIDITVYHLSVFPSETATKAFKWPNTLHASMLARMAASQSPCVNVIVVIV